MINELPMATDESDAAPPPPRPPPSSVKQTIAAAAVVTAIAAAMGALFAAPPAQNTGQADKTSPAQEASAAAGLFDMPPIVTNLGSPQEIWIRLEASIVFDAKTLPRPDVMAEEIAGDELAYLRTLTLSQLEGPIGLQNIREDLNERAAIRSGGKVSELIIRTLVVQ